MNIVIFELPRINRADKLSYNFSLENGNAHQLEGGSWL